MNFLFLPGAVVAVGLVALAAGLYVLQRLRVRQREVTVVTTLFWREALEENRARVLTQRFRHPWTYLFLLALSSLLWLALGGLANSERPATAHYLLLDGSMGMHRGNSFAEAKAQLLEEASALPAAGREVYWCGASFERLLAPGEELPLLQARLAKRSPDLSPDRMESYVNLLLEKHQLAKGDGTAQELALLIYGNAPTREAWISDLAEGVSLMRRTAQEPANAPMRGFVAGGIGEATSGRWDHVDLTVTLVSSGFDPEEAFADMEVLHGQDSWSSGYERVASADPAVQVLRFSDVPANGEDFQLRLRPQDDFAADDQLLLSIPRRDALRVGVSPSLQPLLLPLLAADPAVVVSDDNPELLIRQESDPGDDTLPTLLVFTDDGGALFRLRHESTDDANALLQQAYRDLGMASIDALGLATAMNRPVSVDASLGSPPQLGLAAPLLAADAGFTSSRSFPLLVSRGLRWLVDQPALLPYAAAGRPLPGEAGELFGVARIVGAAATIRLEDQREVHVASFDYGASVAAVASTETIAELSTTQGTWPLWTWLAVFAFLGLMAEWFLFQRGRMP